MMKLKENKGNLAKLVGIVVTIALIVILVAAYIIISKDKKPEGWNDNVSVITTDEGVKIPLPDGFTKLDITNKINEGIVIEDKEGNQFVWVPVDISKFERNNFGQESTPLGYRVIFTSEKDKNIPWDEIVNPDLIYKNGGIWQPENEEEYVGLLASVEKYGGFYIGRYLASYVSGDSVENYRAASVKSNGSSIENIIYEQGRLWNFISAKNAYEVSKNMYKDNLSVVSHIPYGVEYDAIMQWLIDSGSKTLDEINKDSTQWGNTYTDAFSGGEEALIDTGEFEETRANNIYDINGNLMEWTREFFGKNDYPVYRGTYFRTGANDDVNPWFQVASDRWWDPSATPEHETVSRAVGFRVALFVK